MQNNTKDTKLVVGIIVIFVLVAIGIGYAFTHMGTPSTPPASSTSTTDDTTQASATTSSTDTSATTNTNQATTMQPQDGLAQGQAFLAANGKKPGVVTLPDGLQYQILTEGKGPKPTATQTVTVNYEGSLIDGTVFDSSYKRGQPIQFGVNQVIPGWTEALQLMPVGSTWMLYIPANLAYGAAGAPGGGIGPNETLIFKVDLISVN
jgi:FKBP-type peptidyl-prolyl cis-trans isomerase